MRGQHRGALGAAQLQQRRARRLIGAAFLVLSLYIAAQSAVVLATGYHSRVLAVAAAVARSVALAGHVVRAGKPHPSSLTPFTWWSAA